MCDRRFFFFPATFVFNFNTNIKSLIAMQFGVSDYPEGCLIQTLFTHCIFLKLRNNFTSIYYSFMFPGLNLMVRFS